MTSHSHKNKVHASVLSIAVVLAFFGACKTHNGAASPDYELEDLSQSLGEATEIATFTEAIANDLSIVSFMIKKQDETTTIITALDAKSDTVADFVFKKNEADTLSLRVVIAGNASDNKIAVGKDGKFKVLEAAGDFANEASPSRKLFDLMEKSFDTNK